MSRYPRISAYDQRRIALDGPAQGDAKAVVVLDLLQKPQRPGAKGRCRRC